MPTNAPKLNADFRRAGKDACRPQTWKNVGIGVFVALAMGAEAYVYLPSNDQTESPAFIMGGYREGTSSIRSHFASGSIPPYQAHYLQDTADLLVAMDDCTKNQRTCDPHVKAFSTMIEQVEKVPDQLTQIEMVNAYVNTIPYDHAEAAQIDRTWPYHTLKEALDLDKGICLEVAELKAFALETIGFNENDIRVVSENVFVNGEAIAAHAVTAVRIDNKVWVMNLAYDDALIEAINLPIIAGPSANPQELAAISTLSTIETADAQLNFSNHSMFKIKGGKDYFFVPTMDFNSTVTRFYDNTHPYPSSKQDLGTIPPEAQHAVKDWKVLSGDRLLQYNFLKTMETAAETAVSARDQIKAAEATQPTEPLQKARSVAGGIKNG
jgi:predicted transglutaminase-like cysteine proteinase